MVILVYPRTVYTFFDNQELHQRIAIDYIHQDDTPHLSTCLGLQALHRYFRCMAYDKSEARLVIVGEDGSAHKAKTSQQLAAALSVSVWDISNLHQPLLLCSAGSKQVNSQTMWCMCASSHMARSHTIITIIGFILPHASSGCPC